MSSFAACDSAPLARARLADVGESGGDTANCNVPPLGGAGKRSSTVSRSFRCYSAHPPHYRSGGGPASSLPIRNESQRRYSATTALQATRSHRVYTTDLCICCAGSQSRRRTERLFARWCRLPRRRRRLRTHRDLLRATARLRRCRRRLSSPSRRPRPGSRGGTNRPHRSRANTTPPTAMAQVIIRSRFSIIEKPVTDRTVSNGSVAQVARRANRRSGSA